MYRYLPMFIVCLIPAMISLGHDLYLFQQNPEEGIRFASLGWIWANYSPESMQETINSMEESAIKTAEKILALKLSLALAALTIIIPGLITIEYFLLRLVFGKIGPKFMGDQKNKRLTW